MSDHENEIVRIARAANKKPKKKPSSQMTQEQPNEPENQTMEICRQAEGYKKTSQLS